MRSAPIHLRKAPICASSGFVVCVGRCIGPPSRRPSPIAITRAIADTPATAAAKWDGRRGSRSPTRSNNHAATRLKLARKTLAGKPRHRWRGKGRLERPARCPRDPMQTMEAGRLHPGFTDSGGGPSSCQASSAWNRSVMNWVDFRPVPVRSTTVVSATVMRPCCRSTSSAAAAEAEVGSV